MNVEETLTWLAEVFQEPGGYITAETARSEIPGWDSLGVLSLIAAFDERFDIHLSQRDIERMQCVNDILDVLRRHDVMETT